MPAILVIDDEKPTLSMFRLFLESYGYEVHTAETGEEGLAVFERIHPPIVLTDIKMPGMDGIEVLSRIKKMDPTAEVIVITGHGDMDLAIKALNLDATDFINKPIQKKDLDNALQRALQRLQLAVAKSDAVAYSQGDAYAVVDIQGTVTSRTEAHLRNAFASARSSNLGVVLRFTPSASINGAGIAILTQLLDDFRKQNLPVTICGLSSNFRKVFDIVGISRLAPVFDTEAAAAAGLK